MVWSLSRVLRRAIPSLVCVLVVVTLAGISPASAAGSGGAVVDGDYTTVSDFTTYSAVRTYRALYFYGTLTVGDATYDGGFTIAGMSDAILGGGPCTGFFCSPTMQSTWLGRDAGVVRGFDPSPGAVSGECSVVSEEDFAVGPLLFVEVKRTLELSCSISVEGGPTQAVSLSITAMPDDLGDIAGVFTVS